MNRTLLFLLAGVMAPAWAQTQPGTPAGWQEFGRRAKLLSNRASSPSNLRSGRWAIAHTVPTAIAASGANRRKIGSRRTNVRPRS